MAERPTTQPHITVGTALDVGRSRAGKPNQDSLGSYLDYPAAQAKLGEKGLLYIVADGMGGAAGGQEASQNAVQVTLQSYYEDAELDIQRSLGEAIQRANQQIHDLGQNDPMLRGLGTTIVAAVIHHNQLILANAGDSRAYLFRQGQLHLLSVDHSWVQEQVRRGLITEEQAETHPQRNVLTRNLGNEPEARPDFATVALQAGDTFLLCSDGLWGVVSDEEIAEILRTEHGEAAAQTLMRRANEHGGPDNIGIILLHVEELAGAAGAATRTERSVPITDRLESLANTETTNQMPTARLEATAAPLADPVTEPANRPPPFGKLLLALLGVILVAGLGGYFLAGQFGLALPGLPGTTEPTPISVPTAGTEVLPTLSPALTASPRGSSPVAATITVAPSPATTPSGGGGTDTAALAPPILLEPENEATFEVGESVLLQWEWEGPYTLGTHFELGILRDGASILVETPSDNNYLFVPQEPGTYAWDVVVIQGERESLLSEKRTFTVR